MQKSDHDLHVIAAHRLMEGITLTSCAPLAMRCWSCSPLISSGFMLRSFVASSSGSGSGSFLPSPPNILMLLVASVDGTKKRSLFEKNNDCFFLDHFNGCLFSRHFFCGRFCGGQYFLCRGNTLNGSPLRSLLAAPESYFEMSSLNAFARPSLDVEYLADAQHAVTIHFVLEEICLS